MKVWIIGAGLIGQEYAKILTVLNIDYLAIGRGEENAIKFEEATSHPIVRGGIEQFIQTCPTVPQKAIVAVRTSELTSVTSSLIKYGVKEILVEKPGFRTPEEIREVSNLAKKNGALVFIAYNRRFYSSTLKAEEIIEADGGVKSFNFEFTEWADSVMNAGYGNNILNYWFYANSTHVVDLAFFLGGEPNELSAFTTDKLSWHKPAIFAGAGISTKGALFSYQANWNAPGRWSVEILTNKHRLYFKPMEILQIQQLNSVAVNPIEIDNHLDIDFKPGFYLQTKAFIETDYSRLCSLNKQSEHIVKIYNPICGLK